jgi:hypothetical protein
MDPDLARPLKIDDSLLSEMHASRARSAPRCRPGPGLVETWGTNLPAPPACSAVPAPPGRISAGDQMRLQRLREIKAMLERKRQLRHALSGGGGGADGAPAGSARRLVRGPPAAMAGRVTARAQHAASAAQVSPVRSRPPLPPERVLSPAVSGASLRRNVALELSRVRRRALRSGNVAQLNHLRTDAGLAAFERALRIRAHAQVQRRFNGIRSAVVGSLSHSVFPQREIETQTEEAAAGGVPEEWREDEEWTRAMLACDEQVCRRMATLTPCGAPPRHTARRMATLTPCGVPRRHTARTPHPLSPESPFLVWTGPQIFFSKPGEGRGC